MNKLGIIEGLLFAIGSEGLTIEQISELLNIDNQETKKLLKELQTMYESEERGIRISYLGETFKLTTKKEHKEYYQKLLHTDNETLLTQASLETLAIIAYNQPITRVEADELRGVSTVYSIRKLLSKGLIKEVGKSTMPGRPNLYGTTKEFLDYFGINSLEDLPMIIKDEIPESESDLFTSIYKEEEYVNK